MTVHNHNFDDVQFFDMVHNHKAFMLLGTQEDGGVLHVLDAARSFEEAQEKSRLFLEEFPSGGILIMKNLCAAYRLPQAQTES